MDKMLCFSAGLLLGSTLGILIAALLAASRSTNDEDEPHGHPGIPEAPLV